MIRVGMTGGIGSGKSTVSRVFESLGVPVYYTDPRARELMVTDPVIIAELTALLGPGTYAADGELDRQYVASRIFTDSELIRRVNATVHPRVAEDFERWAAGLDAPYVMMECAILFESGFAELVDYTVTVSADIGERVARAASRDGTGERHVRERMANQMTDAGRESLAGFTIRNSDHDMAVPRILELHEYFTHESRR